MFKRLIICCIILAIPVTSWADLTFSWRLYEDPLATHIRMYIDGSEEENIIIEEIPKSDITASVPTPTDGNNHAYYIVGMVKDDQGVVTALSRPSAIATWCAKCPPCVTNVKEVVIPPIEE